MRKNSNLTLIIFCDVKVSNFVEIFRESFFYKTIQGKLTVKVKIHLVKLLINKTVITKSGDQLTTCPFLAAKDENCGCVCAILVLLQPPV